MPGPAAAGANALVCVRCCGVSAILAHSLTLAALALIIEAIIGYPDALFRAIRHPVVWQGALISWLDTRLNHPDQPRRRAGVLALLVLAGVPVLLAWGLHHLLATTLPEGWVLVVEAVLASSLLAQRSLYSHVQAVADGLRDDGLAGGRRAVAMIVGRNPESLDLHGVCRAAIESLAENFSDGVVAPAFWLAVGGLPGLVFYKAVNTADSMIGHRTPRHEAFGWAAARLDDLINLPASRLAVVWICKAAWLDGGDWLASLRAPWRDAGHHRSPNAGWPEAAIAGALGLRLAGPRVYGETLVDDAWMGDGSPDAGPDDLRRALALYRMACAIEVLPIMIFALIARG